MDQHLGNGNIKGRENTEEEDTCNDDNFIDNPLDEQVSHLRLKKEQEAKKHSSVGSIFIV